MEDNFNEILSKTCFFDINARDIDRYAVFFLGIEVPPKLMILENPVEYKKYLKTGKFKEADIKCSAWYSIRKFEKLFKEKDIKYLVLDAHRIPDVHIVIAAKKCNIDILYIQHGMYIPFMKRNKSMFLLKIVKTLRYLYYSINSGIELNDLSLAKKLFDVHVRGKEREIVKKYNIFPDRAAVFSDYWLQWHKEHYAFEKVNMFIIGSPDFRKYTFTKKLDNNVIAYCYQSLVEDGRILKSDMYKFYTSLSKWAIANKYKIIVKVHPVADKEILKDLKDKYNFILEYDQVPNTDVVIGHYSSLLPFWGISSRKVVCVELEGHPVHHSIADWAYVINDVEKLKTSSVTVDAEKCSYYFDQTTSVAELRTKLF